MMSKDEVIEHLHRGGYSCVIMGAGGEVTVCHERGVKDLFRLLTESPETLSGAMVADKVVGKGAAALMIVGGVAELYTDVISNSALDMLERYGVKVGYGKCVPNIINRAGTDICPVEKLCSSCVTADECIPLISKFISEINKL
ncbi:MAG: DUF1893 domain-containing protein [Muribaculaceae bacterium]|nr:DUF1893 domain-containing protein [Muribaculaceae bacterium]